MTFKNWIPAVFRKEKKEKKKSSKMQCDDTERSEESHSNSWLDRVNRLDMDMEMSDIGLVRMRVGTTGPWCMIPC